MSDNEIQNNINNELLSEVATTLHPTAVSSDAFDDTLENIGRFQVQRELGRGGMGVVYECYDPALERLVAVKISHQDKELQEMQLGQFLTEAKINSQLEHPTIVPVYELGVDDSGSIFFAMQKIKGESLRELLQRFCNEEEKEWPLQRLLLVFVQACYGVAYAHEAGVLHRDLKPDNIMLGSLGEVYVLDWGVARIEGKADALSSNLVENITQLSTGSQAITTQGTVIGTPGYMSPEQSSGELEDIGFHSDVWSLGAVLFELLTLQKVFSKAKEVDYSQLDSPRQRAPQRQIPEEISNICQQAMHINPNARYKNARELAKAVEQFLDGSQKEQKAMHFVKEALSIKDEIEQQVLEMADYQSKAAEVLATIPPTASEEEKIPGWSLEDKAGEIAAKIRLDEVRLQQALQLALEQVPGFLKARELLADFYYQKHINAEKAEDFSLASECMLYLEEYDTGQYGRYIQGNGRITLLTEPANANAHLYRYVKKNRRLVLEDIGDLGQTPILDRELPHGSYVVELSAPQCETVRYPFTIERTQNWDATRPGHETPQPIDLPPAGTLGPDDCYIPAGFAVTGGDPLAAGGFDKRKIWIDSFVVRRYPVTHREWLAFINDLIQAGEEQKALSHIPQELNAEGETGSLLYERTNEGLYFLPKEQLWKEDMPVSQIDWSCALAYTKWLSSQTKQEWRLLDELEWEKAARGVDGRPLPWGKGLNPSWCCTAECHQETPQPMQIGHFVTDESPYGVRDLAGGIRDWCLTQFLPEGPSIQEGILQIEQPVEGASIPHVTRGGAWCLPDWVGRICCRGYHPSIRLPDLGLRIARKI